MDLLDLVHGNNERATGTGSGRRAGTSSKPFVCSDPDCQKPFARKSDLVRHERIHTGERPYECPQKGCDKAFIQRSALTVHIRTHTGERPHTCSVCQRAFSDSSSLARHRRTHTGARPYRCTAQYCERSFARKITLFRHVQSCHPSMELPNDVGTSTQPRRRRRAAKTLYDYTSSSSASEGAAGEDGNDEDETDGEPAMPQLTLPDGWSTQEEGYPYAEPVALRRSPSVFPAGPSVARSQSLPPPATTASVSLSLFQSRILPDPLKSPSRLTGPTLPHHLPPPPNHPLLDAPPYNHTATYMMSSYPRFGGTGVSLASYRVSPEAAHRELRPHYPCESARYPFAPPASHHQALLRSPSPPLTAGSSSSHQGGHLLSPLTGNGHGAGTGTDDPNDQVKEEQAREWFVYPTYGPYGHGSPQQHQYQHQTQQLKPPSRRLVPSFVPPPARPPSRSYEHALRSHVGGSSYSSSTDYDSDALQSMSRYSLPPRDSLSVDASHDARQTGTSTLSLLPVASGYASSSSASSAYPFAFAGGHLVQDSFRANPPMRDGVSPKSNEPAPLSPPYTGMLRGALLADDGDDDDDDDDEAKEAEDSEQEFVRLADGQIDTSFVRGAPVALTNTSTPAANPSASALATSSTGSAKPRGKKRRHREAIVGIIEEDEGGYEGDDEQFINVDRSEKRARKNDEPESPLTSLADDSEDERE